MQIFRLGTKLLIFGFRIAASEFETCKPAEGQIAKCNTLRHDVARLLLILRLREWIYFAFCFLDHAFGEFKVCALFLLFFQIKNQF